jgi:anti-sigma factor RsiW
LSEESLRCRFIVQLLTDYLEDALSSPEHNRVADHLAECEACSAFLDQMRTIIRVTGTVDDDQLSPNTKHALLSQFRDWYDEHRSSDAVPPEAEDEELSGLSADLAPADNGAPGNCLPGAPLYVT